MENPYSSYKGTLCVPTACSSQVPIIATAGEFTLSMINFSSWENATITAFGRSTTGFVLDQPFNVSPTIVPTTTGFSLTLIPTTGVDIENGLIKFTLPNGCQTSFGYTGVPV